MLLARRSLLFRELSRPSSTARKDDPLARRALARGRDEAELRARHIESPEGEQDALEAHREADGGGLGPTQGLDHAVVASAAEQRVLGAELPGLGGQLEAGAGVVVDAAHEARVHG